MSQPVSCVSTNLLHTHTCAHAHTPHLSHLMSYFHFWLFLLWVSLCHSIPAVSFLSSIFLSGVSPLLSFSPRCHYQFPASFFPSLFLIPLPYPSSSSTHSPFTSFGGFFFESLYPYPAESSAPRRPPITCSFGIASLSLHLSSSAAILSQLKKWYSSLRFSDLKEQSTDISHHLNLGGQLRLRKKTQPV